MSGAVATGHRGAEYRRAAGFTERTPSPTEPQMTAVLHAIELAYFASSSASRTNAFLLAQESPIAHIMGRGKVTPAKPTHGVKSRPGGTFAYPAAGEVDVRQDG